MSEKDTSTSSGTEQRTQNAGETAAAPFAAMVGAMQAFFVGFTMAILTRIPRKTKIMQGMIKAGYQGLYKSSGAAAIANCIYGDGYVVPKPVEWDSEEQKFRTKSGEEWSAPNGYSPDRIGKAPLVWGVVDSHEIVAPVQARIAEKVDLGPDEYETVRSTPAGGYASAPEAMADGGVANFDDVLVDASNPDAGADGMIVSMKKAYDLHWSQAGTEELRNQEMRGRLAEADPNADKRQLILIIAAILGALALGLFGPSLAVRIAGSGAGASAVGMWITPLIGGWV